MTTLRTRRASGQKSLAILLDPDKVGADVLPGLMQQLATYPIDFILVGGSLVVDYIHRQVIDTIRQYCDRPVILFPGNPLHIDPSADAVLFLSLISGRNADFLIGQHVVAAPLLKKSGLEILPTGYMLVDSGAQTTVSYISGTMPIPHNKPDVAACTAMAGEMLGLGLMYLDAGSGARWPVSTDMISAVNRVIDVPLIVGGGIDSGEKAYNALQAGADLLVVGTAIERNPDLLPELCAAVQKVNQAVFQE
ncbi:phosphoglycerol geranylgeranyltransferase [Spirosoma luteolum]